MSGYGVEMRKLLAGLMIAAAAMPAAAQTVRAGIEAWQRGTWPAPSQSGDRWRKRAMPMPPSISARPIALGAACRLIWRRRKAGSIAPRQGPCGCADDARSLAVPERQSLRRDAVAEFWRRLANLALLMVGTALYNGDGIPATM